MSSQILNRVGNIRILATTTSLSVQETFLAESRPNQLAPSEPTFESSFCDVIEPPMPETALVYGDLTRRTGDPAIIEEIGPNCVTSLAAIWAIMELHANGEGGILTHDSSNVFYIARDSGRVEAIFLQSSNHGWRVLAGNPYSGIQWIGGQRIFYPVT